MDNQNTVVSSLKADHIFKVFTPAFLDEDYCRKWVIDRLHPDGIFCPECGSPLREQRQDAIRRGGKTACYECGKQFTALTGSVFSGYRSDYRTIFFTLFLIGAGFPTNEIMVKTGISRTSICRYRKIFG
jgi:transposase-like protein